MATQFQRVTAPPRETAPATPPRVADVKRPWTLPRALVVAGFAAVAAAMLNFGGLAAFTEPFILVFFLPALLGAALVAAKPRAATYLAGGILVSIAPLFVLLVFGTAAALASPTKGSEFGSAVLLLLGLVLALPAGVRGFRAAKRGEALPEARRVLATRHGAFAVLAAAVALTAFLTGALASQHLASGGAGGYDFTPDARVALATKDFEFTPAAIQVQRGTVTEIAVQNQDTMFHTFTYVVDGTTYNHDLLGGSTARFLVKLDEAGTLQYWCEPHSGGAPGQKTGMVGTLTVA